MIKVDGEKTAKASRQNRRSERHGKWKEREGISKLLADEGDDGDGDDDDGMGWWRSDVRPRWTKRRRKKVPQVGMGIRSKLGKCVDWSSLSQKAVWWLSKSVEHTTTLQLQLQRTARYDGMDVFIIK